MDTSQFVCTDECLAHGSSLLEDPLQQLAVDRLARDSVENRRDALLHSALRVLLHHLRHQQHVTEKLFVRIRIFVDISP